MSLLPLLLLLVMTVTGCNKAVTPTNIQSTSTFDPLSYQLSNMGIVRIRSTYSLSSGNFKSTCGGILLHSGDQAVSECIALSSASCFKHMPRITEHSIEFFDPDGRSSKLFRAHDITIHPAFNAADAQLSLTESAVDIALVKFNCTLPVSVKSARIADFNEIPVNGNLLAVTFAQADQDSSSVNLVQSHVRIESIDFPSQLAPDLKDSEKAGVLTLRSTSPESECMSLPGSPVFYQSGRELFLIASLSLPASDCLRKNHRYTLLSPLVAWMKENIGIGAVSYASQINRERVITTDNSNSLNMKQFEEKKKTTQKAVESIPEGIPMTLPRASEVVRNNSKRAAEKLVVPTIKPPILLTAKDSQNTNSANSVAPTRKATQKTEQKKPKPRERAKLKETIQPTRKPAVQSTPNPITRADKVIEDDSSSIDSPIEIQPFQDRIDIPPPEAQKMCSGKRWVANAKTRVWGTVIKLIDKPGNEILDERMKCDLPNEVEICLDSEPSPTGSGHFVARLLENVELGGCEKFESGETVYLIKSDFISL